MERAFQSLDSLPPRAELVRPMERARAKERVQRRAAKQLNHKKRDEARVLGKLVEARQVRLRPNLPPKKQTKERHKT